MAGWKSNGNARTTRALFLVVICFAVSCTSSTGQLSTPSAPPVTSSAQPPSEEPAPRFRATSVAFWNKHHGLVAGELRCRQCSDGHHDIGIVYATKDGGSSWTVAFRGGHLATDVTTIDRGVALARIGARLLKTSDGGRSWTTLGHSRVVHLSFVNPQLGWGVRPDSLSGRLVVTTDGGRVWHATNDPCGSLPHFDGPTGIERSSARYLRDVSFASPVNGWALCSGDGAGGSAPVAVYETDDGGATWVRKEAVWDVEPGGLQFLADGRGWRWPYGGGLVDRSLNGGATWHQAGSYTLYGTLASSGSVWFVSNQVGFAVGNRRLYRSTNAGLTWRIATRVFQ